MISELTWLHFLRAWKRARLSAGAEALGYPTENILSKAGKGRVTGRARTPDEPPTDAELMQTIVIKMPQDMREAFEACHLCLIRGERYRGDPHVERARVLGVPKSTYWYRVDCGKKFVREWLEKMLDNLDGFH